MRSPSNYTRTQIRLHWIVAALVALQFALGSGMRSAMQIARQSQTPDAMAFLVATLHLLAGTGILILMLWRLQLRWRFRASKPATDQSGPLVILARVNHMVFYALLLLMPITGMLAYYEVVAVAARLHSLGKNILLILVFLHLLAFAYHAGWCRDHIARRMWPAAAARQDREGES